MTKTLSYLNQFVHWTRNGDKLPYNEVNIDGSWECGKTYACKELICVLSEIPKVALFCCRENKFQLAEMLEDFKNMLDELKIPYIVEREDSGYTVIKNINSGSKIKFLYFKRHTNKANDTKFSGLASAGNVNYIYIFLDEAYEISEQDKITLLSKIRGKNTTEYCMLQVCNPYNIGSEYVRYLNKNLPYNRNVLSQFGQQFAKFNKKIFHHLNWRACRDILNPEKMKKIQEGIKTQRDKAITIDLGMPSYDIQSIYGRNIEKICKPFYHPVDRIVCGVDVGFGTNRNAGITGCLIGFYQRGVGVDFFSEYTQANKVKEMSITQRANEIIDYVLYSLKQYRLRCPAYNIVNFPYVNINVDNSAIDFISRINELIVERRLTKVMCARQNAKNVYQINERINLLNDWIDRNKIRIDLDKTPILFEELNTCKLVVNNEQMEAKQRQSANDHLINTLEYALEDIWQLEPAQK